MKSKTTMTCPLCEWTQEFTGWAAVGFEPTAALNRHIWAEHPDEEIPENGNL